MSDEVLKEILVELKKFNEKVDTVNKDKEESLVNALNSINDTLKGLYYTRS